MKANTLLSLILAIALIIVCGKMVIGGYEKKDATVETDSISNPIIDNIMTRASVRAYQEKEVEDGKIDTLLRAGMAAPTACDKRPWRFVVVTDKDQLAAIAEANSNVSYVDKAPLAIVVCGDTRRTLDGDGREFWVQDASAASENILLAAHALGLGAVWTGFYPIKKRCKALAEILELPDEVIPLNVIVIGYPLKPAKPKNKWDEDNVSYDAYDE
ncbi:MAG: nitroreductase family protein [Prevotella sp.]|jgi:nitroreductase